ncbi:hypothetical protein C1H46_012947 [Malus baccata]|uniref:Uncharacterized protein n=1 Tax=Malus baccata TaxID=106549 RepID=A0A540MRP8_MALBA|nr:hypothetical protein C1H46_012947 [Malus baccata]
MELDKRSKLKEEPHNLSGAYIRSLMKQLTSSRTKEPMNPNQDIALGCDGISSQNTAKFGNKKFGETQKPHQPQQHKKQVRRRLHTSRPYQERLLNMAEARREIVTALKFHRAAMKQASEQQQQQDQQALEPQSRPRSEQEARIELRRNPGIYPSSTSNYQETPPFSSDFSFQYPNPSQYSNPYSWTHSTIAPPLPYENFDFTLPNQTLGLNLNFQDFNNINTTLYHNTNSPSIFSTSASSPSSSSSPTLSAATTDPEILSAAGASSSFHIEAEDAPAVADAVDSAGVLTISGGDGMHAAIDDEEMAEIRSIGEQHQMEWNDTMNLVTSAWWFKFLKAVELRGGPQVKDEDDGDGYHHPFDEVMELPAWLNANESCFQNDHLNDCYSGDYFQDPALPCMDIGEIEGVDGEWLA